MYLLGILPAACLAQRGDQAVAGNGVEPDPVQTRELPHEIHSLLPVIQPPAGSYEGREGDDVRLYSLPLHFLIQLQCNLKQAALGAGADQGVERHNCGLEPSARPCKRRNRLEHC